jgi:hypothetical protein
MREREGGASGEDEGSSRIRLHMDEAAGDDLDLGETNDGRTRDICCPLFGCGKARY